MELTGVIQDFEVRFFDGLRVSAAAGLVISRQFICHATEWPGFEWASREHSSGLQTWSSLVSFRTLN